MYDFMMFRIYYQMITRVYVLIKAYTLFIGYTTIPLDDHNNNKRDTSYVQKIDDYI